MGSFFSSLVYPPSDAGDDDNPRVIKIHKTSEWQSHYDEWKQSTKLMVVDFTASWCGPCKFLAPVINDLADKYEDVVFVKIDVDELKDVAQQYDVKAMPTLVLLKQEKEVARVVGAKKDELVRKIELFCSTSSAA